jgi:hypothetical protein
LMDCPIQPMPRSQCIDSITCSGKYQYAMYNDWNTCC